MLTVLITSSYGLVTIVFARSFLKERLSRKQYLRLIFLVIVVALPAIIDIFNV